MRLQPYILQLFSIVLILVVLTVWIINIVTGHIPLIDQWTKGFVESVADSNVYTIARFITELGSKSFLVPFTIVMGIVLWITYRDWFPSIIFAGGTLLSHLINMGIKIIVVRERPRILVEANAEGYSFPSGHAMISMVCYGLLMYLLVRRAKTMKVVILNQVGFSFLILIIGLSRYIINVHYLTDVIAGFIMGYLLLLTLIYLFEWIQKKRRVKSG